MPYIRQIKGHATEARREKLDPLITKIVSKMVGAKNGDIYNALTSGTYIFHDEWAMLFIKRQGKVRYYNFNDDCGVAICAIWEMMRRLNFHVETFRSRTPAASGMEMTTDEHGLRSSIAELVSLFDADRGEAVGEFNYSLSEITLALINAEKISKENAVRALYEAAHTFYEGGPAQYEDASITDPEKGDTKGYLTYNKLHPQQ